MTHHLLPPPQQLAMRLAHSIGPRRCLASACRSRPALRIAASASTTGGLRALRLLTTSPRRSNSPPNPPTPPSSAAVPPPTSQTTPPTPPTPPTEAVAAEPTDEPPQASRRPRRRELFAAVVFLCLGTAIGTAFRFLLQPPPPPEPGTPEDAHLLRQIHARAATLPLVQQLSADPAWQSWDAYSELGNARAAQRITSGPMSGARGLAYQRVFHNPSTGELATVVYFGPALSGWPTIVHGGALATLLDESLGRCAILLFPARTGVTARLELTYKAPVRTGGFYVVKVRPVRGPDDDVVVGASGARKVDTKRWVEGNVATEDGDVCVQAKALFVVPKGLKLGQITERF